MKTVKTLMLLSASILLYTACSKESKSETGQTEIYTKVDTPPEFKGGMSGLSTFLGQHLEYPKVAEERNEEGTVFISFVVTETGKVSQVKVKEGLSEELNEAALVAVKNLPDWNPGIQDGKAVSVQLTLPIKFQMPE